MPLHTGGGHPLTATVHAEIDTCRIRAYKSTDTAKVWHLDPRCRKLGRRVEIEAPLRSLAYNLCDTCRGYLPRRAEAVAVVALATMRLVAKQAAALQAGSPVADHDRLIARNVEFLQSSLTDGPLAETWPADAPAGEATVRAVVAEASATVEAVAEWFRADFPDTAARTRMAVTWGAGVSWQRAAAPTAGVDVTALRDIEADQLYTTWALRRPDLGAGEARHAVDEQVEDLIECGPSDASQIPEKGRFDPAGYPGPRAWALAEWAATVRRTSEDLLGLWEGRYQTIVAAGTEPVVAITAGRGPLPGPLGDLDPLEAITYRYRPARLGAQWKVYTVPGPVGLWLAECGGPDTHWPGTVLGPARQRETTALIEALRALPDPGPDLLGTVEGLRLLLGTAG